MKKIFYFMNVDIKWIKQRPHFIAEELNKRFEILVYYPFFYNRKILTNNGFDNTIKTKKIIRVPNVLNNWLLIKIVDFFMSMIIKINICKEKPDILFLCSPEQVNYIPKKYKGTIMYDCMDNLVALARTTQQKNRVYKNEKEIIKCSTNILVSSNELKKIILQRYKGIISEEKVELCRNAFNGKIIERNYINIKKEKFKIGYFGTVSTWFDFKMLNYSLDKISNIEYHIAGPIVNGVNIPENKRIKYHGIIKHENLIDFIDDMDCLIMPFIVNDVTKSVDPVKFYEYINFNKNIISIYYDEIQRFYPFVYFYKNKESFIENINCLIRDNSIKYTDKDRKEFLKSNNWNSRCNQIELILGGTK